MSNTKVIRPINTAKRSGGSDRVPNIEEPSKASGNSSRSPNNSHYRRGLEAEAHVRADYEKRGFETVFERWRTPFGEIDLVFRKGDTWVLVEVKSIGAHGWTDVRLGFKQRERLRRIWTWFSTRHQDVEFHYLLVKHDNSFERLDDILL